MRALADILAVLPSSALSQAEADALFEAMLTGGLDQCQIAGVLGLLAARGPSVDEVVGAARAMRRHVTRVPIGDPSGIVDTCGTGGAPKTFNVSTAAAIVAAGAGARVAKHGNRSRTGRGSAEVLAALGVNVDATPEVQARCVEAADVCFCFAIHHHPAARHAAGVRRALKIPTIFNLLGPLTNPAGATRQLIGVYDAGLVDLTASALVRLGSARAMVVHSRDGLDEISVQAPTLVAEVRQGVVARREIDPRGLVELEGPIEPGSLVARDTEDSARMIRSILAGGRGPSREMVVLNAAGALVVADLARDLESGCRLARESIDSGRADEVLRRLVATSNQR